MKINYKFRINLITVILSQVLIQIYLWHNIPVSGHIPLPIILLISIFLSGLAICTAFWLAYDSDRFKQLSLPKQIILLVLYTAGFTFLILYDFM